ncbi:MAG TPA: N-acetylmuramoyl-L-alanine amidase [Dehalococcoidia bacterium]|nr:N-acetylmuramoyl-L-alanine amidase [Dehalococcoidia bacterium]
MPRGWCPFARHLPRTTFGYPRGARDQNRPRAFVCHVMDGFKRTMDEGDWMERAGVGVTAAVGKDGSISQYTSIFDAHWGNGVVNRPRAGCAFVEELRPSPRRPAVRAVPLAGGGEAWVDANGVNVINSRSIALEHEGFSGEPFTGAMVVAAVRFLAWCNDELRREGLPPVPIDDGHVIAHADLDSVNRRGCPGRGWPKERYLALLAGAGGDMMMRYVRPNPNWPRPPGGAVAPGAYDIQARLDFALPEGVRWLQLEVRAEGRGRVVVLDGGAPVAWPLAGYAGSVRNATAQVRVLLDEAGAFRLVVEDGPVRRLWLTCVGYFP